MKLKNEITVVSDEEIQSSLDVVSQVLISNLTVDMQTTELPKVKNLQVNQTIVYLLLCIMYAILWVYNMCIVHFYERMSLYEELLLRLKEDRLYTCRDLLVPQDPGMIVRECMNRTA